MASIINADSGISSNVTGITFSADNSGALNIQTNGVTAIAISASQVVSFPATTTITFGSLNVTNLTGTDLSFTSGTVTNLSSTSANITTLTGTTFGTTATTQLRGASANITNLTVTTASISDLSATVLRASSGTITNLLATSLTVSSGSTLNGGVVINEPGADADTRIEGDTDANLVFVDASTDRVGVGTNSPSYKFDISGAMRATGDSVIGAPSGGFAAKLQLGQSSANTEVCLLSLQNTATETATTGARIDFGGASNWLGRISTRFVGSTGGGDSTLSLYTASGGTINERLLIDQNGNVGIGTNSPGVKLDVSGVVRIRGGNSLTLQNSAADANATISATGGSGNNTMSFNSNAMVLNGSGNLGVGTTSPGTRLHVSGNSGDLVTVSGAAKSIYLNCDSGGGGIFTGTSQTRTAVYLHDTNDYVAFFTTSTERARITSGGNFLVGQTSSNIATTGIGILPWGRGRFCVEDTEVLEINRKTSDGVLVIFYQDTVTEGTISVSGNTVSYNAFAGSHWSQLQDGSKPDILRGTVMESINELCVWPGEQNERLPKSKISDTAGSKKVYGVFMAWDNDWTTTNDMYVTAVGAFICRVNGSVTVQEGDLLESNGDGTARVQADDIIRSSTIGKVTSTVKTHEYDDGSYCVPTVLYCG